MLPPEIMEWIMKGGLIAFLIYAWQSEKARADKERASNETLARDSITQSAKTEAVLDRLASILTARKTEA